MSTLCWNCRGLASLRAVRELRMWCSSLVPDILFLSETKVNKSIVENNKISFNFPYSFGVSSIGRSGGLCIYWRDCIDFTLVSFSQNHICGDVKHESGVSWRFVGLYGWPEASNKHKTWSLIRQLCDDVEGPILFGGDFNEILSYGEKESGVDNERRTLPDFRETLHDCELRDLGYEGQWFTWEKGRTKQTLIRERLDRFVANGPWFELSLNQVVDNMARKKSDHSPIFLKLGEHRRKKRFWFETHWLLDSECEEVVRGAWRDITGGVGDRLKRVAGELKSWSSRKFKGVEVQIEKLEKDLKEAQGEVVSDESLAKCADIEKQLEDLFDKKEAYWYLRSRVSEIKDGDRNTKYFHHKAFKRGSKNEIKGLYNAEGNWKEELEDIKKIVEQFYRTLFSAGTPSEEACTKCNTPYF
ncbi:uncharacterized protein LOC110735976 [Chenopodium quinoa]|uniref:uncharacterized protein LOC110735976 n=1 Tax=Chenopodium quinoa TaxID=63459 RepID=UPI000B79A9FE|nr:uncharacterized protein LOC110735976 [Chenopodium quinoa]